MLTHELPQDSPVDPDAEPVVDPLINQAEAELARQEVATAAKVSQAVMLGQKLTHELKKVEGRAKHLHDMNLRTELRNRLDGVTVPSLDLETHMKRADEARWRALEVRSETLCELERAAAQLMEQLQAAGCRLEKLVNEVTAAEFWDREVNQAAQSVETSAVESETPAPERAAVAAAAEAPRAEAQDRRTHMRVPLSVRVGYQSETNFYGGITEDLSVGGVFIATYDVLPCGREIDINVCLPTGHELRMRGTVRWLREHNDLHPMIPAGMGVEFEELSAADRAAIEAFVTEREPMLYLD